MKVEEIVRITLCDVPRMGQGGLGALLGKGERGRNEGLSGMRHSAVPGAMDASQGQSVVQVYYVLHPCTEASVPVTQRASMAEKLCGQEYVPSNDKQAKPAYDKKQKDI